ncbi:MAG: DUF3300 domain-containing protein [Paraglaciecola sp.]|uniref:DUF3300 domain-containing protein n=1 Tax=Paraglaciecola sp. TaxID=1920173 RepID=UPI003299AA58
MGNQKKYLLIYLCILCVVVGSLVQLAQADEQDTSSINELGSVLDQAEVDQMLAPIALYPDTLLSHILVAATYPLEVVQAARWRNANDTLDAEQALDYAETQDWDPSVQALVPFNDLLQTLSGDLQWLQQLGEAFLYNEEQVLSSIQTLRQKAYALGTLRDNEYLDVEQQDSEIIIQPVQKEVVYVPYYDTRVVYGSWWHHSQPYRWHRPLHSVLVSGFYWSIGFHIRPSFYFGGFFWPKRHVFADYNYRRHSTKYWSQHETKSQKVKVRDSQRWTHNTKHRRGVQYHKNGQKVVYVSNSKNGRSAIVKDNTGGNKNNKKRIIKYDNHSQNEKLNSKRVKTALQTKNVKQDRSKNNAKSKYQSHQKKSTVYQKNSKQHTSTNKQVLTEKNKPKSQQYGTYKASKVDKSQSQTASYNRQNQTKSTKQSYNTSRANSNRQSYKAQNKSRNVNSYRQSRNQQKQ